MTGLEPSTLTGDELSAFVGGYYKSEPTPADAIPDPEYVAAQRRRFVELCALYGAGNVTLDEDDYDKDGCGGLLAGERLFPVDGCPSPSLSGLADDAYRGGAL
jgi:hypothetical protein